MTRDSDGGITLKMPLLIALLSAALAVGSGGAWMTGYARNSEPIPAVPAAFAATVEEHHRIDEARDAVAAAKIVVLEKQLDTIDRKLDRLLARR